MVFNWKKSVRFLPGAQTMSNVLQAKLLMKTKDYAKAKSLFPGGQTVQDIDPPAAPSPEQAFLLDSGTDPS